VGGLAKLMCFKTRISALETLIYFGCVPARQNATEEQKFKHSLMSSFKGQRTSVSQLNSLPLKSSV